MELLSTLPARLQSPGDECNRGQLTEEVSALPLTSCQTLCLTQGLCVSVTFSIIWGHFEDELLYLNCV